MTDPSDTSSPTVAAHAAGTRDGAEALDRGVLDPGALDRGADALLALAADLPWRDITLRAVAERAGVGFADLYARAPGKAALLWRLSERFDRQAFAAAAADDQPSPRDRLFEAFMARLEAMEPHRAALIALARGAGAGVVAPRLPMTARGLLEAAGIDTSGPRGALRLAAFTAAWMRTLAVWRDDEGALNRTMAEIDKLIARTDRRLARVGAGLGGAGLGGAGPGSAGPGGAGVGGATSSSASRDAPRPSAAARA